MEEGEATQGMGISYNYNARAAQAAVERERYFNECIRNYQEKNNHSTIKSK